MAEQSATQDTFGVVPHLCISCDACAEDFPEVFFMGDDGKAHVKADAALDKVPARDVVDCCPTGAITWTGNLPAVDPFADVEEVEGWEVEWSHWRGVEEDKAERDRRYGNDFKVEEGEGYVRVTVNFPRRVPAVRDRFRFGLPEEMPLYRHHFQLQGTELTVAGWVKDKKIRALTHRSSAFPAQFVRKLDLSGKQFIGTTHRFDAHAVLDIVLFTDELAQEAWEWRSHWITDKCTACTICERVCPTNAITSGELFYIDPDLCINCSVCGVYCPYDAITDNLNVTVQRIKIKQIPKARVHEELCTGCEFCVDVCPFEALEMKPLSESEWYSQPQTNQIAFVIEKNCVSCKLCEQVCIKDAIEVPREHQFQDIGMSFMHYVSDRH